MASLWLVLGEAVVSGVSNINRAGRTYITLIMNFYKIAVFCNKSIVFEI